MTTGIAILTGGLNQRQTDVLRALAAPGRRLVISYDPPQYEVYHFGRRRPRRTGTVCLYEDGRDLWSRGLIDLGGRLSNLGLAVVEGRLPAAADEAPTGQAPTGKETR